MFRLESGQVVVSTRHGLVGRFGSVNYPATFSSEVLSSSLELGSASQIDGFRKERIASQWGPGRSAGSKTHLGRKVSK